VSERSDLLQRLGSVFQLLWLVIWSAGVAALQYWAVGVVEGGDSGSVAVALLFSLTHGGSEIGVMVIIARRLGASARTPGPLRVDTDLGARRLSWRTGSTDPVDLAVGVAMPVLAYPILVAPLALRLSEGVGVGAALAIALYALAWAVSAVMVWVPTWRALGGGWERVIVQVQARTLLVVLRGLLRTRTVRLPAARTTVRQETGEHGTVLHLEGPESAWAGPVPAEALRHVSEVERLLEEARSADRGATVPESLRELREQAGPDAP
jgi:hypothetical protein